MGEWAMKGSETGLLRFMGGYSDRYIIPVYQRRYNWRKEECRQLYQDLQKIVTERRAITMESFGGRESINGNDLAGRCQSRG